MAFRFSELAVIGGISGILVSVVALAYYGLPYSPLSQIFSQSNPYGDPIVVVSGRVILQGQGQEGLPGTSVTILGPEDFEPINILTSLNGSFSVELAPGIYRLEATRAGWMTQFLDITLAEDDLNLSPIGLLLDGDGECPGAVPGDEGAPWIVGVGAGLSPDNTLIEDFDVQLNQPGQVWVEYHPVGDASHTLQTRLSSALDPEHQFPVMRLWANTSYCYQVFARAGSGGGSGPVADSFPGKFTTGSRPAGLADSDFTNPVGDQTYDLTLLDFNDTDFNGLVALDADAQLVWYHQHDTAVFAAAQKADYNLVFGQIDGQNHVEINPDGTLVRQITDTLTDGTPCAPTGRWHHESLPRPDGTVLFMGSEIREVDINGTLRNQTGDLIMEWDQQQGTVTPLASLFDFLDPAVDRTNASNTTGGFFFRGCDGQTPSEDWTHANSIWVADDGSYIVSIRHLNQIIALEPDLQSVRWRLGGPGSDFAFPDTNDRFYFQHSAKLLPNGNLLLFDNGNARPAAEGGQYSRALELELDLVNMEARKVWEYRADPDLYAGCCSSVQRLENGDTVVVFGNDSTHEACCRVFTLVEADAQGDEVSVIEITSPGKQIQYRAYPLDSISGESRK